jgi:pimeloyl-ACP methyl ester carboxylesterase
MGIMAKAVELWLDAQGVDSFVVVGHSMGGYVALELLSRIPNRIAGLGLFHSHPLADDEEKRTNRRRNLNLIREVGHTRFMDAFVPALFAPSHLESCSDRIHELCTIASNQCPQNICRQIDAMMYRRDRLDLLLKHHSLPKWVVLGDQDPVLPLERAWEWVSKLDNLQLDILPNTAHMGMDECPLHCVRLFEEFSAFVNRAHQSQG